MLSFCIIRRRPSHQIPVTCDPADDDIECASCWLICDWPASLCGRLPPQPGPVGPDKKSNPVEKKSVHFVFVGMLLLFSTSLRGVLRRPLASFLWAGHVVSFLFCILLCIAYCWRGKWLLVSAKKTRPRNYLPLHKFSLRFDNGGLYCDNRLLSFIESSFTLLTILLQDVSSWNWVLPGRFGFMIVLLSFRLDGPTTDWANKRCQSISLHMSKILGRFQYQLHAAPLGLTPSQALTIPILILILPPPPGGARLAPPSISPICRGISSALLFWGCDSWWCCQENFNEKSRIPFTKRRDRIS